MSSLSKHNCNIVIQVQMPYKEVIKLKRELQIPDEINEVKFFQVVMDFLLDKYCDKDYLDNDKFKKTL